MTVPALLLFQLAGGLSGGVEFGLIFGLISRLVHWRFGGRYRAVLGGSIVGGLLGMIATVPLFALWADDRSKVYILGSALFLLWFTGSFAGATLGSRMSAKRQSKSEHEALRICGS
jgi:hypothetical protein